MLFASDVLLEIASKNKEDSFCLKLFGLLFSSAIPFASNNVPFKPATVFEKKKMQLNYLFE